MTGSAIVVPSPLDDSSRGAHRIARLGRRWWLRVIVIWVASRIVTTLLMLFFAAREPATYWDPPHPGYFRFAQFWDSGWFHTIATAGYPAQLPVDAAGHVLTNAWAFLPVYPAAVDALIAVTGIPWDIASVLVAALCSLGAVLVLDRLMAAVGRPATFVVALFCFAPLSAVLQVAYAEATALLLLCLTLLLLVRRRYLTMIPVLLLTDLTRPLGPPLAIAMAAHVAIRLIRPDREGPLRGARLAAALAALAAAVLGAVTWPAIAWIVTGDRSAYVETEVVWRQAHSGTAGFVPFVSWLRAAESVAPGVPGVLLLVGSVGVFATLLLAAPSVRSLGVDLRIWVASYAVYLFAVFDPQSSTFRLLIPLFPLLGAFAGVRSRVLGSALLGIGVAGQFLWIAACWARWHITGMAPP